MSALDKQALLIASQINNLKIIMTHIGPDLSGMNATSAELGTDLNTINLLKSTPSL